LEWWPRVETVGPSWLSGADSHGFFVAAVRVGRASRLLADKEAALGVQQCREALSIDGRIPLSNRTCCRPIGSESSVATNGSRRGNSLAYTKTPYIVVRRQQLPPQQHIGPPWAVGTLMWAAEVVLQQCKKARVYGRRHARGRTPTSVASGTDCGGLRRLPIGRHSTSSDTKQGAAKEYLSTAVLCQTPAGVLARNAAHRDVRRKAAAFRIE
jgi:hypothetical protein